MYCYTLVASLSSNFFPRNESMEGGLMGQAKSDSGIVWLRAMEI